MEDPLPMLRLPARGALRNVLRDTRALLFRETFVDIELTTIWLMVQNSVRVPLGVPTIDRIEVTEFEMQEALGEWLKKTAPAFLRASQ